MPIPDASSSPRNASAARRGPGRPPVFPVGPRAAPARLAVTVAWLAVAAAGFALSGCGAPGAPDARHLVTPQTVMDLAARQQGDAVVLTFTLPTKSTDQDSPSLAAPPSVEIYSGSLAPGAVLPKNPDTRLVNTIPGAMTKNYQIAGHFQFSVPFDAADVARAPGMQQLYQVRTRASKGGLSQPSAMLALRVYPSPAAIDDLRAAVTEPAIVLNWTPPDRSSTGAALASALSFRVYRVEVHMPPAAVPNNAAPNGVPNKAAPGAAGALPTPPSPDLSLSLQPLAPVLAPPASAAGAPASPAEYRDTVFEFGHIYLYSVRSVISYGSDEVESADSNLVTVSAKDVFPPAAPQSLLAVFTPAAAGMPPYVELTWAINSEPDLAGYIVYRSDQADSSGQRLNPDLLPAPAFRDMSAQPGRRYFYRVSAVDTSGNESAPSAVIAIDVP